MYKPSSQKQGHSVQQCQYRDAAQTWVATFTILYFNDPDFNVQLGIYMDWFMKIS